MKSVTFSRSPLEVTLAFLKMASFFVKNNFGGKLMKAKKISTNASS
jgi:hypothetical protein